MNTVLQTAIGTAFLGVGGDFGLGVGGDLGLTPPFAELDLEQVSDPAALPIDTTFIGEYGAAPPVFTVENGSAPPIFTGEYGSAPPIFVGENGSTPHIVFGQYGFTPHPTVSLQIRFDENFFHIIQNLMAMLWFHAQSAFMWKLIHINCTDYEAKSMADQSIPDRQLQFSIWRRSVFIIALPAVGIRIILSLVGIFREPLDEYFNSFGIVILIGYILGLILDGASICASMWFWNTYEKSSLYLAIGWLGSTVLSLCIIAVPVSFIVKDDIFDDADNPSGMYLRWAFGMIFILQVFPILIIIPMSMIRGSLYIKGLLPEISIPGCFIALMSPVASILILVTAVMISQLTGDFLSFIGILLQILAPIIMAIRSRLYTAPRTEKIDTEISWIQWTTEGLINVGLLCLIIWASEQQLLNSGREVTRFLLELFGRSLITTVFFADRLFDVSIFHLFSNRKAMGGFDWTEMKALTDHYNVKYSDFNLTGNEMNHLKRNMVHDEN